MPTPVKHALALLGSSLVVLLFGVRALFGGSVVDRERLADMDLLRADLIVRGSVTDLATQMVPVGEYDPLWAGREGYFPVTFVGMQVSEVLLGSWDNATVTFTVNQGQSDVKGPYSEGDEIIVALKYIPFFRGGMFQLWSGEARFNSVDTTWVSQAGRARSIDEIRSISAQARLEQVVSESSEIVLGEVVSVEGTLLNDPNGGTAVGKIWMVQLRPEKVLKGAVRAPTVTFGSFIGGSYWPSWAMFGPQAIEVGAKYCVFLQDAGEGKVVTHGSSGILAVQADGRLLRNGYPVKRKITDVEAMIEE